MPITALEIIRTLLHREPLDGEVTYWDHQILYEGLESVFKRFVDSDEYKSLYNDRNTMFVPAGHFYSPIVDLSFVLPRQNAIFGSAPLSGSIELNEAGQISFLRDIAKTAAWLPFQADKVRGLHYYYENGAFPYGDAIVYASMIEKYRPRRIVEIGSGFSSALALDVVNHLHGYAPEICFIDPYPQLVEELIGDMKNDKVTIKKAFIQDCPPTEFDALDANDFYFMDTTHVVKTGSDVLYHFEKVLPRLRKGVILHLHDIFFPFEYPQSWVIDLKLSWNELYYFRAFMTNNPEYEILYFNSFMSYAHRDKTLAASTLFARNGGASIWFRKR